MYITVEDYQELLGAEQEAEELRDRLAILELRVSELEEANSKLKDPQ